jgi:integrase
MGSWKKAWYALRKEAGKRFPRLLTIRRYDLRHNAATKLLENPDISERTIEEMMGHKLNSRIKERYSHIRMEARKQASEALQGGFTPGPRPVRMAENVIAFGNRKKF